MRGTLITILLLLSSAAVYGSGHAEALALPARGPEPVTDVEQLAQAVAEHLTAADLVEPQGNRLRLSIRGDLLFIKGVVNSRSASRVHEANAMTVGIANCWPHPT